VLEPLSVAVAMPAMRHNFSSPPSGMSLTRIAPKTVETESFFVMMGPLVALEVDSVWVCFLVAILNFR